MRKQVLCAWLLMTSLAGAQTVNPTAVIPIWPEGVPGAIAAPLPQSETSPGILTNVSVPVLSVYPAPDATRNGTAVVVCPGGGYRVLAINHEGRRIAEWLNGLGVTVFVLWYRVPQFGHPAPLQDVTRALRLVRRDAATYRVDPQRIGVLGFSAGGHLAASAANLYDDPASKTGAPLDLVSARPDFHVLVYPVVTMTDPYTHAGSREYLLGKTPSPRQLETLSIQNRVTVNTPPAFIVHGHDDTAVPAENSVLYYLALKKAGVSGELHVYQQGPHGFGRLPAGSPTLEWMKRCEEWMRVRSLVK